MSIKQILLVSGAKTNSRGEKKIIMDRGRELCERTLWIQQSELWARTKEDTGHVHG